MRNHLSGMATFVAVAEQRSFGGAAKKLGLSPAATTRAIAHLEEHLAVRLLQRTTRSVTLTDAGARYLRQVREILARIEESERALRAVSAEPSGRLVLTAPLVFGRQHVAPLLNDFLARYPKVQCELTLSDRLVSLVEEGIDLAIRIGVPDDSSLHVRPLGATRRVVVASPRYLEAHRAIRRPGDLEAHTTIQLQPLAPTGEWTFRKGRRRDKVTLRPAFSTNSAEVAVARAEAGGGVALLLAYQVWEAVRRGRLRVLLASYEPPPLPIQAVYPSARFLTPAIRKLIDLAASTRRWDFVDLD
jgi:DNA-binding transcriptional LysR family regulator